ncbi:XRE family transcriptional regulator [Streptomyces silvensis]|uniref:XRE family transcriptional regulator n=1 Tax=Streptomyces silvensis TaxID=1765722 RepID=UPI0012FEFA7E|nr:XRE family transcriptional regulator [Streptomyces silvensis]
MSASTLSAWQTGLSRPERASSLAVVSVLEEILELPPGSLLGTLPPRRPRGRRATAFEAGTVRDRQWGNRADSIGAALARLGADWGDLASPPVLSYRVRMQVGPEGGELALHVTRILHGGSRGGARMVYVTRYASMPHAPLLTMTHGCRLARFRGDPAAGVAAYEFLLDDPLSPGELALTEFRIQYPPRQTEKYTDIRVYPGTREVVLETVFDAAYAPAACQAFHRASPAAPVRILKERSGSEARGGFQYIRFNPAPGIYGIRWE